MEILREQIRERIIRKLNIENKKLEQLYDEIEHDYANLWIHIDDLPRIRAFLIEIIKLFLEEHGRLKDLSQLDRIRFRNDINQLLNNTNAVLQRFRNAQITEIGNEHIDIWEARFKSLWVEIRDLISKYDSQPENTERYSDWFHTNYYFKTYDEFSEKSRDNAKKAITLAGIAGSRKKLFEIGPGTGSILRRLSNMGFEVEGIDNSSEMIKELEKRSPKLKGKVLFGDFLNYTFNKKYDIAYIESSLFLFTLLDNGQLVFEYFSILKTRNQVLQVLRKIYLALNENGLFMIGIQGLMKEVRFAKNMIFRLNRIQLKEHALRIINYSQKAGRKEKVIYSGRQYKLTMYFDEFQSLANMVGFKNIHATQDTQWVVLEK